MINRIDETSSNYKIKKPNKKNRNNLLDIKNIKNSNSLGHSYQEWTFLSEIISNDETLRIKLERRGIYVTPSGGIWIFLDNQTDVNPTLFSHYIGPDSIINYKTLHNWNRKWITKQKDDSEKWQTIKFNIGYSTINIYNKDYPIVNTVTTTDPWSGKRYNHLQRRNLPIPQIK